MAQLTQFTEIPQPRRQVLRRRGHSRSRLPALNGHHLP